MTYQCMALDSGPRGGSLGGKWGEAGGVPQRTPRGEPRGEQNGGGWGLPQRTPRGASVAFYYRAISEIEINAQKLAWRGGAAND